MNNLDPSDFQIHDTGIEQYAPHAKHQQDPIRPHSPLRWVLVQPARLDDLCDGGGTPGQPIHGLGWELGGQEAAGQG